MLPLRHKSIKQFLLTKNTMLMKFFTKLFAVLAFLCVSVAANAEKVYADLSKLVQFGSSQTTWDNATNTLTWHATSNNMISPFDFGLTDATTGKMDLSSFSKIVVKVTSINNAEYVRVQMKVKDGAEVTNKFSGTGEISLDLSEYGDADKLSAVEWVRMLGCSYDGPFVDPATAVIAEVYLERPDDPLALPKDNLSKAIAKGKMFNALAYTEASFGALGTAVSDGETALADAAATVESLTDATTAITDAIDGLAFADGFSSLKDATYGSWSAWGAGSELSQAQNPTWTLFEATGQSYGDPSVNSYAELSDYDKLYVVVASGTPRILLNRDADGGQCSENEAESHLIDNTNAGCMTWASDYFATEGKVYSVDLKSLTENKGFAHLHAIKSYDNNVVTGLYLYKAPAEEPGEEPGGNPGADMPDMGGTTDDGLIANKLGLNWVIYTANQIELEGMSRDSKKAFETALAEANKVMKTKNATIEQIKAAENNLRNAMKLLEPASAEELSRVYATFEKVTDAGSMKWDAANMNFSWDLGYSNQVHNITLPNGDITQFEYIYVDCDILSGDGYRIMFYAADKGTTAGGTTVINESGLKGFKLSDFEMDPTYLLNNSEFCLSGYNASGKVHVNAVYFVPGNGTTTAINGISQKSNDSNVIFNLKGQRLSQPAKGINIINGKKVVIK